MKRLFALPLLLTLATCASPSPAKSQDSPQAPNANDARMEWWRDARFGMFIHWGLYAIPAGTWGNETHHGEWIMNNAHIPVETYEKFKDQFNPIHFDAGAWVKMAKNAGMKYIVITSKHHDGFCLWDSKYTDYDVMSTPFKRDILKELESACAKEGIKLCFYHSIMDWHHPDYLPRREWEQRPAAGADYKRYVAYLRNQVSELLTTFKDVGILWFDGEWEGTWTHADGQPLYELCRKLQPNVIVNNRVDKGRSGMAGMSEAGFAGDYGTPEQEIPATGMPGLDWETCMTMNNNWGYNSHDKNFKSTEDLIHKLSDIASKGGNYLLNIGPMANGEFPPESVERLAQIGKWMKTNGEAIYGTSASPFEKLQFNGRCTQKRNGNNTSLYFHIFDWPADGKLTISGLGNEIIGIKLLGDPARRLPMVRKGGIDEITNLPRTAPDAICSVLRVDLKGAPIIYEAPRIEALNGEFIEQMNVTLSTQSKDLMITYTLDGSEPSVNSKRYIDPILVNSTTVVRARSFHANRPVSGISERKFTQVSPWPPVKLDNLQKGLAYQAYDGKFDKLPDFSKAKASPSVNITEELSLPKELRRAHVAVRFWGIIIIPKTELYTFSLGSDDGSRLFIDGKLIVNNDGLHPMMTASGMAPLSAGAHRVEIQWFNREGDVDLNVKWGAGIEKLTDIPAAALSHEQ